MKSFILLSLVAFIQLFVTVQARAVDGKEVSVVYKFDVELEKYKHAEEKNWVEDDFESEIEDKDMNKRMITEEEIDDEYEEEIADLNPDEFPNDLVPNEFPNEEDKLTKRALVSTSAYFRSQLSSFEKMVYDKLSEIFNKSKISTLKFEFSSLKSSNIKKSYILKYSSRSIGALVRDHPEYWWIKQYSISYSTSGSYITKLKVTITSNYSLTHINKYNPTVKSNARKMAEEAKAYGGSKLHKRLLYIHNTLIKRIQYVEGSDSYNLYGALVRNRCVCEGYAESFAYIARLAEVPSICVTSSSHKWNYVYLKSSWYAVDVTYDDPIIKGKSSNASGDDSNKKENFFLVGRNTVVKGSKTYTTYSNRKLVNYLEFTGATGFEFPTLSSKAYSY